ncbi:unnamed protein product [Urochloa decumbens]|uniref:Peptide N-acetyl-beta-D-glucosaminyl asparaginase amidase A N-terminal domain-containing protein n=1 Tax=Urochloa decumbens TaxID=240449 RepID=A0ABC9H7T6_9POAL
MPPLRLLLQLLLLLVPAFADVPDRYSSPRPGASAGAGAGLGYASAEEYLDPTFPVPRAPPFAPSCVVPVLSYSFANTYGAPPATAAYAPPPDCPAPWSLVVLSFSAAVAGDQYDRVAAVWLDGAELLRTTTAEPTPDGVRWTVRKDVTRHSTLLRSPPGGVGVLSVMLENLVNDQYTGAYNVTVSLEFHGAPAYLASAAAVVHNPETPALPESYFQPADLILPISEATGNSSGFWYRIQNSTDSRAKVVTIPPNTYRAVLEIFVSPHSNDEFWYSNPPDIYIRENNLTTGRGNAAYREVVATVDRRFAGSFVPFPVIYTGGINPLFWQPVAALGAFNLPTYDIELTPFLGLLVDDKAHEIALSVVDGIAEWLVDANLHLWLDPGSSSVSAALGPYATPRLSITRGYTTQLLDGSFSIQAKRESRFSGWVKSSFGNFTTEVKAELKATSLVELSDEGRNKTVTLDAALDTAVAVRCAETGKTVGKVETEAKYPLWLEMLTEEGAGENGTQVMKANLTHSLRVETEAEAQGLFEREEKLADEQAAAGWMLVRDHEVVSGSAATTQAYRYKGETGRYERAIDTLDGAVLSDNVTERHRGGLDLDVAGSTNFDACCRGRRCHGILAPKCLDVAAM